MIFYKICNIWQNSGDTGVRMTRCVGLVGFITKRKCTSSQVCPYGEAENLCGVSEKYVDLIKHMDPSNHMNSVKCM